MNELKTLPLYTSSAHEKDKMFAKQRRELQVRGDFVRAYQKRGRSDGNGQTLDPVLASHLGLTEPEPDPKR